MKDKVAIILKMLESGQLITPPVFDDLDLNDALDARDDPIFDKEWMRVYDQVKPVFESSVDDADLIARIDKVRELSFIRTDRIVRIHDIAGYVSGDFELFCWALLVGFEDPWLNALWNSYRVGRFPRGGLDPIEGKLADLL
jgi:hypothetical protein